MRIGVAADKTKQALSQHPTKIGFQ